MSKVQAYRDYNKNPEFETRNVFERENIQISRPDQNIQMTRPENIQKTQPDQNVPMIGLNENIPMTRLNENSAPTRPTEFLENEKGHVSDNLDPEPSLSDSSSKKSLSDLSSNKKELDKNKTHRKNRKDDSSDPSSSGNFDLSNDSDYRRKGHKKKNHRRKDTIKLCASLMAKFLTIVYKSNISRFKMDEDPLQRWIYFLTFVESLEMIFSQYTETCEVIIDYPKIGGYDIEYYAKKTSGIFCM